MLDRIFLSNSYSYRKKKCAAVIVFIAIYLLIPTIVTLNVTGVVYTPVNEDYSDGRKVIVKYRNATQEVGVDRFMEYMTTQQMKSKWGKDYEDNYNLVKDCTAATSGLAIRYNDKYIEARYTYITSGSTLSGASILGDEYAYLSAVECNNDKNAQDYLVVKTISNKDFVNSFEKKYDSINLDKNNLAQQIQIVSKNEAGYVLKLQIGNVVMSGSEFAYVLGINSPNFSIEYMQTGVKITTIGVGEGFGVSVYTADCMAKAGSSYEDIIETFYNKINIISE